MVPSRSLRVFAGFLMTIGIGATLALGSKEARAALMLELSDGVSTVVVVDNGLGDTNGGSGILSFAGSVGGFLVSVSTGISKPVIGGPDVAALDLNSFNLSGAPNAALTLRLTDTDFAQTPVNGAVSMVAGVTGGSVAVQTYADFDNTAFGTTELLADFGIFENTNAFAGTSFSASQETFLPIEVDSAPPFSLTIVAQIMHGAAWQTTSFDVAVTTFGIVRDATAPGGLGLFALGLAWLSRSRRRAPARRGNRQVPA